MSSSHDVVDRSRVAIFYFERFLFAYFISFLFFLYLFYFPFLRNGIIDLSCNLELRSMNI